VGTLVYGIKIKLSAVLYYVVFLIRRMAFACISVFAGSFDGALALTLAIGLGILYQTYLCSIKPNSNRKIQRMEVIGEILLLYCLVGVMFCEKEPHPMIKYHLGWFSTVCVCGLILLQLINLIRETCLSAYQLIRKWYLQRKQAKDDDENSAQEEPVSQLEQKDAL